MHWIIVALLMLAPPVSAAECLRIDAGFVRFEATQRGEPVGGRFDRFGGKVCIDGERIVSIAAWLEPASANTGDPEADAALRGAAFFATKKFPRATFNADDIEMAAAGQVAHGELTLKGYSQTLSAPITLQENAGVRRISGTLTVDRLAFDIGTGEWADTGWLAREVTVRFEAALRPE